MENQYDINKWKETGTKNLFIWKFFLSGKEIPGWKITDKSGVYQIDKGILTEYYWQNYNSGDEAIKIDVYEFASWNEAQKNLLRNLHEHMAERLPKWNNEVYRLGDVSYSGLSKIEQHLLFVRANMLLILNSIGKKDISVREIARILDDQFYSRQTSSDTSFSPVISRFFTDDKPSDIILEKGVAALNIVATDPLNRAIWYKFSSDYGEFFRQGDQIFFEEAIGRISKISVQVTNEDGNSSEKMIDPGEDDSISKIPGEIPVEPVIS